ncbi:hypothetical protein, partial [Escherichia coli]|uniref:hypothetical protein n=1 Tax=Escherichia coli TaxID=562 RepID=UPI0035E048E5
RLESEILADRVSEESRRWLASFGLTVEQMQNQMDPVYRPARKHHPYPCAHLSLSLPLIRIDRAASRCAAYACMRELLNHTMTRHAPTILRRGGGGGKGGGGGGG